MMKRLAAILAALALFCSQASAGFLINSYAFCPAGTASIEFVTTGQTNSTAATSKTISSVSFGTAYCDGMIVVAVTARAGSSNSFTSMTLGGVSATQVVTTASGNNLSAIYALNDTSQTSGDIVIGCSSSCTAGVTVYKVRRGGGTGTASDTDNATGSSANCALSSVTIPTNGVGVFVCGTSSADTWTWSGTGVTEQSDFLYPTNRSHTSAMSSTAGTNTATATHSSGNWQAAGASWGP